MKIAYIINSNTVISGKSNGIRSQALIWKEALEKEDNISVVLISNWGSYNWKSFDAIHIFGYDSSILNFVSSLYLKNKNIFLSPIIDSTKPYWQYKLASYNGLTKFRLLSSNYALKSVMKYIKGICVRTDHELGYFTKSLNVDARRIFKVTLSFSLPKPKKIDSFIENKEVYCLHVSSLYQDRKNVKALIDAAKKYEFNLKLVGSTGNKNEESKLLSWIGDTKNIELLGFVEYEELIDLYKKAKVFALPSKCEGVGIVALDAALYGCNIVLTNIAGPKEYYPNTSTLIAVNPNNLDQIGEGVDNMLTMKNTTELSDYILNNYSLDNSKLQLIHMYKNIDY